MFPQAWPHPITRREAIGAVGFLAGLGANPKLGAVGESLWTPLRHEGRDYLPLQQVGAFYRLGGVQRSGRGFRVGALKGECESKEFWISRVKFILSFPVSEIQGELCLSRLDLVKLIEPVLRPGKIEGAERVDTVVLDPGHGGSDAGAAGPYGNEKTFTLDVALRASELLSRAGYRVALTRASDEYVPLEERAKFANRFNRSLLVSVHFNSGGAGTGVESYALSPRGVPSMAGDGSSVSPATFYPGNARDAENTALVTATHAALVASSGMTDRGVKRARFLVIREAAVPGVLLEAGFLSSAEDARRIASPWYRQLVAGAIVEGVRNYRRAVGGGGV